MSTTLTMTTPLNTSNVRGTFSRQTRSTAPRSGRTAVGSSLRQNSLVANSNLALSSSSAALLPGAANPASAGSDPPGMCTAITHFADAIAALPRDYRRHTSLLKEVDAKAWAPEENLQTILERCLEDTASLPRPTTATAAAGDELQTSVANSVVAGLSADNASVASVRSAESTNMQRRQQFAALRHNLMAIMVTMDEKNHVINNANEEAARHIRRLDRIWPHLDDEISEESRLGSLKHWAYTETVPSKKKDAPVTRREAAAASLASLHETDAAHRSESRREAVMARRQRAHPQQQQQQQQLPLPDSDFDESRPTGRKGVGGGRKRAALEALADPTGLGISVTAPGKRKKTEKAEKGLVVPGGGGAAMERSISSAMGGRPMSRDNSQQDTTRKRKASAAVTSAAARKRLNATAQDHPRLPASSPLVGNAAKEPYKRSPALSAVRPAVSRGRQSSAQPADGAKGRPSSSSTSNRNGSVSGAAAAAAQTVEADSLAVPTAVKSGSDSKTAPKETGSKKSAATTPSGKDADLVNRIVAVLMEEPAPIATKRNGSRSGLDVDAAAANEAVTVPAPVPTASSSSSTSLRPPLSLSIADIRSDKVSRGRASKTSTPVVGTFSEVDATDSASANGTTNGQSKPKRPARPRPKDHGLHDSLSPKGLPQKRSHKKGASLSMSLNSLTGTTQRFKDEAGTTPQSATPSDTPANDPMEDEDDETAGGDDDEARYCYCNGVSYGEMLACDNEDCKRQWFHLECLGLKSVPKTKTWYCEECREKLARHEIGGKKKNGGK